MLILIIVQFSQSFTNQIPLINERFLKLPGKLEQSIAQVVL